MKIIKIGRKSTWKFYAICAVMLSYSLMVVLNAAPSQMRIPMTIENAAPLPENFGSVHFLTIEDALPELSIQASWDGQLEQIHCLITIDELPPSGTKVATLKARNIDSGQLATYFILSDGGGIIIAIDEF